MSEKPNNKLTLGTNLAPVDVCQDLILPNTGTSLLCVVHLVTGGDINDTFVIVFVFVF